MPEGTGPTPTRADNFTFGLWTVGWHDDDLIPSGSDDDTRQRDIERFKAALAIDQLLGAR